MIEQFDKLVFIDLETTGPNPATDRITEIGIVEVNADGARHWSTLVNPQAPIPSFVRHLTGIDDDMVRDAPLFDSIGEDLLERLDGGLFIAHNARFDYGFLRNAFKRLGTTLRCEVLCTVKLSRKLFPHEPKHSLDALIERHGLIAEARHRALADADLLWQYWRTLEQIVAPETLRSTVEQLLQRSNLPEHLDPDLLDDLPDCPGVYVFHGEHDVPLHVGKAAQLRQRVLSHFHGEHPSPKDQFFARELRRIEWRETAGEIGAQLIQAELMARMKAAKGYAARPGQWHVAWQLCAEPDGRIQLQLRQESEPDFGRQDRLYGLFTTRQKADMALRALMDTHGLCPAVLGLEPSPPGTPCRSHLDGHCHGACLGVESAASHAERLEQALASLKPVTWPYPGPVALVESGNDGQSDIHVIDNWCYLGTVHSETELHRLLGAAARHRVFDAETYRIVSRALALGKAAVRPLEQLLPAAAPLCA